MPNPACVGVPVKLIATDFGGAWTAAAVQTFTVYDDNENTITVGSQDYLELVSMNAIYDDSSTDAPGKAAGFILSEGTAIAANVNSHLLLGFSTGFSEWHCGGEGIFLPPGQTPVAIVSANTSGTLTCIVLEGRYFKNPTNRAGFQNPAYQ
jgi:hypothetical protein